MTQRIESRAELVELAKRLRVGMWHEPDEQNVTASVHGVHLDNAGSWPLSHASRYMRPGELAELPSYGIPDPQPTPAHTELYVTIHQDGEPLAHINLATLLSWASADE